MIGFDLKDFRTGKYHVVLIVEDLEGRRFKTTSDFIK